MAQSYGVRDMPITLNSHGNQQDDHYNFKETLGTTYQFVGIARHRKSGRLSSLADSSPR